MARFGDTIQRNPGSNLLTVEHTDPATNFHWGNRNAKDWSRNKFKELFLNQKYDTSAGICTITELESCEGDAYAGGYSAEYNWTLKLKWKGEAQDIMIPGTLEIQNFSSSGPSNDLKVVVEVDSRRPEAERFRTAFRSVIIPRVRGHLDTYVYFLLDVLKAPGRQNLAANKPSSKNIWLKSNQNEFTGNEGEGDATSSQHAANADIFQEREGAGGMRVGRDFQAKIPPLLSHEDRQTPQENNDRALLVWSPTYRLSEEEIERYLETSRDKYQYSGEQALGLLFWHRYDIDRALQDLGNFTPHPEEWTVEDKVLFEQAFQFHGKAFDRIRQMLPDKSMSNLIRYYYKWKKFKNKTSVMDRQAKKFSQDEDELITGGAASHNNNNKQSSPLIITGHKYPPSSIVSNHGNLSDIDDDKAGEPSGQLCSNCGIPCTELAENMCNTCFVYWKRTGDHRPLTGPLRRGDRQRQLASLKQRQYPPKGMFINHDDLNKLASSTPQAENVTLQGLEKRVIDEKHRVQMKKQDIEILKRSLPQDGMSILKQDSEGVWENRVSSKWSNDEMSIAVQGVRRYGRNFQKIAQVVGTKTEAQMKAFYATQRKRYNLDNLLKEHDLENESDNEETTTTTTS